MQIIQISDTHLLKDAEGELLGCNTRESFDAIVQAIKDANDVFDLILLTGDLSHDGSPESYSYLAEALQDLRSPVCWLPGNHDDGSTAKKVLDNTYFLKEKELNFENWGLLLVDTQLAGEVWGYLTENELNSLEQFLHDSPQENLLVSFHHQPLWMGSKWLDGVGLQNRDAFERVLKNAPKLRAVVFGHVHQEFDQMLNGVRYLSSPSTCIQFLPSQVEFALDRLAPGYRILKLNSDGSIETTVKRLEHYVSKVDFNASGY